MGLPQPPIPYNPAPPSNPLEQQARILAIQAGQLQNQQTQMDVDSQRAFQRAYTEANGDPDKTTQLAAKYGAKPKDLLLWQSSVIDQKMKTLDLVQKQGDVAKLQADLMQGAHDAVSAAPDASKPFVYQQQLMGLKQRGIDTSQLPMQYPGDQAFALIGATVKTHTQMVDEALKNSDIFKNNSQGAAAQSEKAKTDAELNYYKQNGGAPGVSADQQGLASYLNTVPGASPSNYSAWKAAQEAKATQPYKIEQAAAEGRARQLIQGMGEAVYGIDPQTGQKNLMSKTDALQGGIRTMLPVTEKQVSDDTMLINRLGDVRQKIARYNQALQQPISQSDKDKISGLLSSDKFQLGAHAFGAGIEIPVDRLNQALDALNVKNLSPAAKNVLLSYLNTREAMVGYQRVLSGSGRSSEQAMELNLQTLPSPVMPNDYAKQGIEQFMENLKIVGQGLPNIPGVKSPEQWENEITQPKRDPRKFPAPIPLSSLLGK